MSESLHEPVVDDAPSEDRSGVVLAERYQLLRRLGEGGMGEVYLAKHLLLDKPVAIKILAEGRAVPRAAERFFREARATAAIGHPHIVDITDFGRAESGEVFIVMEYLEGEDLADMLYREGRLPWARVRKMMVDVCRALQAAHAQGIVHRDLKPENIFRIEREGDPDYIKVLDFGIAKLTRRGAERRRLTNTGAIFGTVEYMAPEQARGKEIDHRVDVYALAVIAYELLTGRVPFDGEEWMEIAFKHVNDPVVPPSQRVPAHTLPAGVDEVLGRALAKDPAARYPTMAAFATALLQVDGESLAPDDSLRNPPPVRPPEPSGPLPVAGPPETTGPQAALAGSVSSGPFAATPADASRVTDEGDVAATWTRDVPIGRRRGPVLAAVGLGVVVVAGGLSWWLAAGRAPAGSDPSASVPIASSAGPAPAAVVSGGSGPAGPAVPVEASGTGDAGAAAVDPDASTTTAADADAPPSDDAKQARGPRGLSRAAIKRGFADARTGFAACRGTLVGGKTGDAIRVQVTVRGSDGKVTGVRVLGAYAGSKVGGCVAAAVRGISFPRFDKRQDRFRHTVEL